MKFHPYTYLRLSVIDQCNFNCFYCRPSLRNHFLRDDERLSFPEMLSIVRCLADYGTKHIRFTGGEPLLRAHLLDLVQEISSVKELECLSLTTNGLLLSSFCRALKDKGVKKINVSLDTLKKERFRRLTGVDAFEKVRSSLLRVKQAGLEVVKLNCIIIKDFNDDEILDFVAFGQTHGIEVRFIEYFQTQARCDASSFVYLSTDEVKEIIRNKYGTLELLGSDCHAGPAQYYHLKGEETRVGFISSVTEFFCGACNRLRLTSDGKLYPCLHSAYHVDLRKPLRENDGARVRALIEEVFFDKKLYNKFYCPESIEMSRMGG
jgi:cyclic pyranopterin phosphate synthase